MSNNIIKKINVKGVEYDLEPVNIADGYGEDSVVCGSNTTAYDKYSFAGGNGSVAGGGVDLSDWNEEDKKELEKNGNQSGTSGDEPSTTDIRESSFSFGEKSFALGKGSVATGSSVAAGNFSTSEGKDRKVWVGGIDGKPYKFNWTVVPKYDDDTKLLASIAFQSTGAYGMYAHSEGQDTLAKGTASHTEGHNTFVNAPALYAHAEGDTTQAEGKASHAECYLAHAKGDYSHAEGCKTKAVGIASHAEGGYNIASGKYSHAEGFSTEASAEYSHAEGEHSVASGNDAHAEGCSTKATGVRSHAEGFLTEATGESSHAEGYNTVASGRASHAGGYYTIASADYQTAIGTFNQENEDALFIVGNGEYAQTPRSNAFEVLKDGTAKVGGKKVATEEYVNNVSGGGSGRLYRHIVKVEYQGGEPDPDNYLSFMFEFISSIENKIFLNNNEYGTCNLISSYTRFYEYPLNLFIGEYCLDGTCGTGD